MSNLEAQIQFAQNLIEAAEAFLNSLSEAADVEAAEEEVAAAGMKVTPAKKTAPAKKAAAPVKKTAPAKATSKPKPEPEPEPEDDEDEDAFEGEGDPRYAELSAMKITALRALAIKRGFDEEETKATKDKTVIAQAIWSDEKANPDEDEADADDEAEEAEAEEADDAEETEEEAAEYSREDLSQMGLRELKNLAKGNGIEASELRGKDADAIIDMLLGDSEDDEDEAEEEEGEGYYSEEDLRNMSLAELKTLCKDYGIRIPRGADEEALVEAILAAGEDEDDE